MDNVTRGSVSGLWVVLLLAGCGPTGGALPPSLIDGVLTQRTTSAHIVFHYAPGDQVDAVRTEAFYAWIAQRLAMDPNALKAEIQYFKFQTVSQKQALTGIGGNGHAIPWTYSVYTIWGWDNHEITHVLTGQQGYPPDLFDEGFAVANQVDPSADAFTPTWNMVPLHACARALLAAGTLPALQDILETNAFRTVDPDVTYPTAGSFVAYLIEQYSLPAVMQLFPGSSWNDAAAVTAARFEQLFGTPLASAEQDWRAFLQSSS